MRYLHDVIARDLEKKMVLISGPRQCGKTTLAKSILSEHAKGGRYLNWDYRADKKAILQEQWSDLDHLLVLDELHKYPRWKSWLKGVYDVQHSHHAFLVTGSARLDVYRRGGDSLFGRQHTWRLHPFSLSEVPQKITKEDALRRLLTVGGFPEPFLDGDMRAARRWRDERFTLLLRQDIQDLENVRNLQLLGMLAEALQERVGGMVVTSNLAEDLEVAPKTVKNWLGILEQMYYTFNVYPISKNIPRALKKPAKVYFFDNMDVQGDEGARFENLVANHVLKETQFLHDRDGHRYAVGYVRDKEHREVDFAIYRDKTLLELIEVKLSDATPSKSLLYYGERLRPKRATQIVHKLKRSYRKGDFQIVSPIERFSSLEYLTKL